MEEKKDNIREEREEREEIFSRRVRAGRRTYFFDVRATRAKDYYLTITESKRMRRDEENFYYEKHKLFLYGEDFDNFSEALEETLNHIKNELLGGKAPTRRVPYTPQENVESESESKEKSENDENESKGKSENDESENKEKSENDENESGKDESSDELKWD